jgi:LPS sulfotransferase NodH
MHNERLFQRHHMFRLWRKLSEHIGVQTPAFKYSTIYRQPKQTLIQVAEAIGINMPPLAKNQDIVAALDNYVFP